MRRRFFDGWIVLSACTTVVCVARGALFSRATFPKPIVEVVLARRVESVAELVVTFGGPVGFGGGAFDAPLIPTVTKWFGRRRPVPIAALAGGR